MKIRKFPELVKVKGRIREKGLSYRELSRIMGIGVNTLNDKLNGYSSIYLDEAVTICENLDISLSEIPIFFAL